MSSQRDSRPLSAAPQKHELAAFYRDQLRTQILPFWLERAPDRECGGYFSCLDRQGRVYDADKVDMLMQGRIAWTFGWMYNEFERNPAWLDFARIGVDFVLQHGFREDGRLYYGLTRDGRPMFAPSLFHAELSNLLGFLEVARATGDEALYRKAREMFECAWAGHADPSASWNAYLPESGPYRLHGNSMIILNVIQQLREYREEPGDRARILECIDIMRNYHLRPERRLLLEFVGMSGEDLEGTRGRSVNPGHMIEGGIFLIHENWRHPCAGTRQMGLDLIRWGFEAGWDPEFGGIFNDVDAEGRPIYGKDGLLADCKLWWQHAEALYGLLLAHAETGEDWFWEAYQKTHAYSFSHFADPEFGEWFAYLDRTGRLINEAKGSDRKCCYHVGRNFLWAAKLAERWSQPEK